jgi:hypothetical protein
MTHAPILTALSPDFSGQKWTLRKSSGGLLCESFSGILCFYGNKEWLAERRISADVNDSYPSPLIELRRLFHFLQLEVNDEEGHNRSSGDHNVGNGGDLFKK